MLKKIAIDPELFAEHILPVEQAISSCSALIRVSGNRPDDMAACINMRNGTKGVYEAQRLEELLKHESESMLNSWRSTLRTSLLKLNLQFTRVSNEKFAVDLKELTECFLTFAVNIESFLQRLLRQIAKTPGVGTESLAELLKGLHL